MNRGITLLAAVCAAAAVTTSAVAQGRGGFDSRNRDGYGARDREDLRGRDDNRGWEGWRDRDYRRDEDFRRDSRYRRDRDVLHWRGRVDDRLEIILRGDRVLTRNLSGRGVRDVRYRLNGDLPRRPVSVTVRKHDGRGWVQVVQQPRRENGYTAIIRIVDRSGGADDYDLTIDW